MVALSFYVSNFTEKLNTLIVKGKRDIKASDLEGQDLLQKIDQLNLRGIKLTDKPRMISVFYNESEFYIRAITNEKDLSGRPANISIYGEIPKLSREYNVEDWIFEVIGKIKTFSEEIKRPLLQEHFYVIESDLRIISQKRNRRITLTSIKSLILAAIIPLAIGWFIGIFSVFDTDVTILLAVFFGINNILMFLLLKEKNL